MKYPELIYVTIANEGGDDEFLEASETPRAALDDHEERIAYTYRRVEKVKIASVVVTSPGRKSP